MKINKRKIAMKIGVGLAAAGLYLGSFFYVQSIDPPMTAMPQFSDLNSDNVRFLRKVYMDRIMPAADGGSFGTDELFTRAEAAYTAVCIYEDLNEIERSYEEYEPGNEKYIEKAEEYGVWPAIGGTASDTVSREEAAAIYFGFVDDNDPDVNSVTEFRDMERYEFAEQVKKLYNKGVSLGERIGEAFSPDIAMTRGEAAAIIALVTDPALRQGTSERNYEELEAKIKEMFAAQQGDWSMYFMDYDHGDEISINSHQMYSASLIKLFVIQSAYKKVAEGRMSDTTGLEDLLRRMITYSDNDAWNAVAKMIGGGSYTAGMAYVTQTAAESGFADTGQFYKGSHKNFNFTSVNDCGAYMRKILDGEIVSEEYSAKILDYLKHQEHLQKIPAGVPEGVVTANKTGELEYNQGDAAIVYSPGATYILVIIGDDLRNAYGTVPFFKTVSETVYNFIND